MLSEVTREMSLLITKSQSSGTGSTASPDGDDSGEDTSGETSSSPRGKV